MSVAEMKKLVIDHLQRTEDEKLIAEIIKSIQAYEAKFNAGLDPKDIFTKVRSKYDVVLKKLAE